ncbi:LysR family transcriptional regulator, partial [Staphylococcus aureus]|uniref:LysR family transcriptional regulator n=1 Tax=Staphylococcus aureus TaxID=1280 RepID=UPI001C83C255
LEDIEVAEAEAAGAHIRPCGRLRVQSRLISDLEAHLQTRLLHRTTRRLALTEAGERYLERCRGILEDIEVAEAEAAGAHIRPCGRLRVQSRLISDLE